ncbi:ribosomal large subunit pseudouridine synthase D [Orenia metallireducens]|uniref:Pseudouridine synthase n=1 Tax=Orenia metallireducens TaxID=1413210 RepID=A0A285FFH4_9FIRM|nr:RluA family pseudouridine synthase [Orenia metallireducens]PRX33508.1 ribosomal large subunit pseudouridine synthase D [Orenia metallireducens]SNY09813.1 ribosomal large subunit pseudouridine synthase D [Orenia metallireducens]
MKDKREFIIEADYSNKRVDKFLSKKNDDLSRSYLQELIDDDKVLVNGKAVKKSYKLSAGDKLELLVPEPEELEVKAENIPLDIIYEDDDIVVVNKQPDLVVHPAPGNEEGTLVNALLYHCDNLSGINGVIRPGIVHRLDKDTSGAMVVAKNDEAHLNLTEQFKERDTKKIYLTLVEGKVKYKKGKIDAAIGRDSKDRKKMAVTSKNSKKAVSGFKVLKRYQKHSLVEVNLETGRTHQIRLHMEYMGHPVVGDELYGYNQKTLDVKRQMLHSHLLGFYHPRTGEWVEFEAPLLEDMRQVLDTLE